MSSAVPGVSRQSDSENYEECLINFKKEYFLVALVH